MTTIYPHLLPNGNVYSPAKTSFIIKDGRNYKVEEITIRHGTAWKVWQGTQVLFLTCLSLGIALSFEALRVKWENAITGNEKRIIYTEISTNTPKQENSCNPLYWAVLNKQIAVVAFIEEGAPEEFKASLKMKNNNDENPLHCAANQDEIKIVKFMAEKAPEEFKVALKMQDKCGWTPFEWAVHNNNIEMMKLMAETAPEEFQAVLKMKDKDGVIPLHWAVCNNNIEIVKFIAETAPEQFKATLGIQNKGHLTPLQWGAVNNNIEIVKLMAERAPEEFKAALKMQDDKGWSPLHWAAWNNNIEMVKLMGEQLPEALNIVDESGESVLSLLKEKRPDNYREITRLFKNNLELRELYKTRVNRKALAHAFDISWETPLIKAGTKKTLAKVSLEGHSSAEWFHLMRKNLDQFKESYPTLLKENQIALLKHLFDLGANSTSYSVCDKVKRIQEGLPVIINAGYQGHAVTLLIWGDQFVICNRGATSNVPIEAYQFNPLNFNEKNLLDIEKIAVSGSEESYKQLFSTFQKSLNFVENKLVSEINKADFLDNQSVGNCTFVSPITAICAFMLLAETRGVNEEGSLVEEKSQQTPSSAISADHEEIDKQINRAISGYQTWLSNLQISILENNIKPLENGIPAFEIDHELIVKALYKAHLLSLDKHCEKRLDELTAIYIKSLKKKERAAFKNNVIYWKSLSELVV